MKERIMAMLGFPPPAPLRRVTAPYGESIPSRDTDSLLLDGRSVKDEAGLRDFSLRLQGGIRGLRPGGRAVLLSLDPKEVADPHFRAFQRSVEGICRSLAKEIGAKGSGVNLLRVPKGADEASLAFPLAYFGSGRSAFVTGQALAVGTSGAPGSLKGKVCIVTGGAGGIGSAAVQRMASEGAEVVIADMPQMEAKVASLLGGNVHFQGCDLTDAIQAEALLAFIREKFGRLDVLVNNAGITRDKTLGKMPEEFWDRLIAVNLTAVLRLTDLSIASGMMGQGGRIIHISSISGVAGNFGQTNYTAAKSALISHAEALASEVAAKGITANAIAPGFIETDMVKTMPFMTRVFAERLTSLAQAGRPSDIAEAIAFLSHPMAQGVNGQLLRVCGGSFLGA